MQPRWRLAAPDIRSELSGLEDLATLTACQVPGSSTCDSGGVQRESRRIVALPVAEELRCGEKVAGLLFWAVSSSSVSWRAGTDGELWLQEGGPEVNRAVATPRPPALRQRRYLARLPTSHRLPQTEVADRDRVTVAKST